MQLAESGVKANLRGTVTGGAGPDLTGYPHLTYAPSQWGEGVRCASSGAPVHSVAFDAKIDLVEAVAKTHHVTLHEVVDSIRYARANGLID